jgi:hypothetical protein
MAHPRMTHQDLLDQLASADVDQLRLVLEHGLQRLIELEASAVIGAEPYERTASRTTHRNGHRSKLLDTGVGRLELQIPKLRVGSFFPTLLEPRRRIDRALLAVIQEARFSTGTTGERTSGTARRTACSRRSPPISHTSIGSTWRVHGVGPELRKRMWQNSGSDRRERCAVRLMCRGDGRWRGLRLV